MSRPPLESNPLRGLRFKKHADLHSKKTGNPISIPGRNSQPPTTSRIDLTDDVDDVPALSNATNSSSTPATYQPSNSSFPPSSSRSSGRLHTRRAMYHANLHPTSNLQNKPKPKRLRRSCQNLPLNVIFASKKSSAPSQPSTSSLSSSNRSISRLSNSIKASQFVSATSFHSLPLSKTSTHTLSSSTTSSPSSLVCCSPIPPSPKPSTASLNPPKTRRSDSSSVIMSRTSSSNSPWDPPASTESSPFDSMSSSSTSKEPPLQSSRDLWSQMQESLFEKGISLQSNRIPRRTKYTHEAWDQVVPEDFSPETTQVIDNPDSLCPFCDEVLPQKPSAKLIELLAYLKSRPQVVRRLESKNPLALHLPFSETGTCCQLHRAEKMLIPKGIQNGWPSTISFARLPSRIHHHRRHLHRVCTREIASDFMEMALKDWATQGPTKAQSLLNELATFEVEQPGYYGIRGYEVIYRTLQAMFLGPSRIASITKLARPLSPDFLIRKVLIPEAALCLIADDLKLDRTDPLVRKTLEDSRSYGAIMFPDQDDGVGSPDEKSRLEEEQEKSLSLSPKPSKSKRIRKSESCEIEVLGPNDILPSKDQANVIGFLRPPKQNTNQSNLPVKSKSSSSTLSPHRDRPLKRPRGDSPGKIYPKKHLKDGWKPSIF